VKEKEIEIKQIDWFDSHWYKVRYENEAKNEVTDYLPSVTTILGLYPKPFLQRWRGDIGNREADMRVEEAAERGSRIHHAWYTYMTGGYVIYHPPKTPLYTPEELADLKKRCNNQFVILTNQDEMYQAVKLELFYKALAPGVIASEMTVVNLEDRDAGTLDNVFEIKKGEYNINGSKPVKLEAGKYVFDLKTGKAVSPENSLQASRYAVMYEQMEGVEIQGALIGHTNAATRSGIEGFGVKVISRDEIEENNKVYLDIMKVWKKVNAGMKPTLRQLPGLIKL
jgi:hypothetical protein